LKQLHRAGEGHHLCPAAQRDLAEGGEAWPFFSAKTEAKPWKKWGFPWIPGDFLWDRSAAGKRDFRLRLRCARRVRRVRLVRRVRWVRGVRRVRRVRWVRRVRRVQCGISLDVE